MPASSTTSVTISYRRPGAQPPVFVAGTFSDPTWQPQEMQCTTDDAGEKHFAIQLSVWPGQEYRYKFKTAESQDWVLDEHSIIVTDGLGNRANSLKVPPSLPPPLRGTGRASGAVTNAASSGSTEDYSPTTAAQDAAQLDDPQFAMSWGLDGRSRHDGDTVDDQEELKTPLFAHESFGAFKTADDGFDHQAHHGPVKSLDLRLSFADDDDADVDDPTLEHFPSERSSVLDTLRKIQSSHDENRPHLEDLHLSPREALGRSSVDVCDGTSPSGLPCTKSRENRLSHSSFGHSRSAALGSIAEEPKAPGGDRSEYENSQTPSTDADEAQTMSRLKG